MAYETIPAAVDGEDVPATWGNAVKNSVEYLKGVVDAMAAIPSGMIAMWHGSLASIPAGWVLCDGTNGTPNLIDKFVQGVATSGTNPGATGGATNKTTAGHGHTYNYEASPTYNAGTNRYGPGVPTIATGTDTIADIRPKYYALAFIMKS